MLSTRGCSELICEMFKGGCRGTPPVVAGGLSMYSGGTVHQACTAVVCAAYGRNWGPFCTPWRAVMPSVVLTGSACCISA